MKSTLEILINNKKIKNKHKLLLDWFQKNKDNVFKGWLPKLDDNSLLICKPKGIYKPKDSEYALSIRISKNSPYDDEISVNEYSETNLKYFQENKNIRERDTEYTNIGMQKCMKDKIPIGLVVQLNKKPEGRYKVLGTGMIEKWKEGFYHVKIFNKFGEF